MTAREVNRAKAAHRKTALRDAGKCISGPIEGFVSRLGTVHGPVVRGGKCQRCFDVHAGKVTP